MFSRRSLLLAGALAPFAAVSTFASAFGATKGVASQPSGISPPNLDELLRSSDLNDAALSPDGSRVALLGQRTVDGKRVVFVRLGLVDAPDDQKVEVALKDYEVDGIDWANNERLLIWVRIRWKPQFQSTKRYGAKIARRLISVGLDGGDIVTMFSNLSSAQKSAMNLAAVVDRSPADPRKIIMQRYDPGKEIYCLYAVDLYTGEAVESELGAHTTDSWFTQNGVAVLRFDSSFSGEYFTVMGRAPGEKVWKTIRQSRRTDFKRFDDMNVVGSTQVPSVILISERAKGENFLTVRKFDLRTLETGEVVLPVVDRDLDGVVTDEQDGLLATVFTNDRVSYNFADPALARKFEALEEHFAHECNIRLHDVNLTHDRLLLKVSGPRLPGAFFIYDVKSEALRKLGEQRPWLPPQRLSAMETLKVKCRDGSGITAYLTTPAAASPGPQPMIVMPHGGPEARDSYDYDYWAQALASQGWMVLQPNFRGSSGYGKAFADAGRKRWGELMQADVEDAVAHVVASGRADPTRLAILGMSYGGYAALMGVVRQPRLYRCAVGIAGDYDLEQSLAFTRREEGVDSKSYAYWRESMGNLKTDRTMLAAASPRLRATEIEAPVLLFHGDADTVVTPDSSRAMNKALAQAGKTHEYVELKGIGHRDWGADTHKLVLTRSIGFIAAAFGQKETVI